MVSQEKEGLLRAATRRGMAVLAGAPAVGLVLAACAGPGTAAPGAGGASGAAKISGTVELWSNSGYAYKDRTGARLAQEFEQQHPGLKVNWADTPYADFMSKLVTTAVAGNPPDISYADRYVTKSFACKGAAAPLDEYVKRSRTVKLDNFWPQMRSDVTYNGKLYGMPHQGGVGLVWFNRNHFKEAGLDPAKPPATWDQAVQAIQRLTRRAGTATERAGWVPQRGWGVPWMVMYWQLGGELMDAGEKKAVFNNDRATQVFDWLLRVHDLQGGEDAITELYAGANANDAFAQGKVSMVWAPNSTWRAQWASRQELDVGNTFWPTPPGGKRSNYMGGWSLIVPKGAKNPDAAFAYLEYKLSDDPQVRWALDWDSTPSTRTAATNERYLNSSPERKTAVEDMPFAKWVIAAPGGDQALKFQTGVANNVFQRKMTVRDALDDAVRSVQNELDEAARACGA